MPAYLGGYMKRFVPMTVVLVMVVFVVSCGKKEVKKVSEDSRTATETFAIADGIKNAYLKRDLFGIESNTTRDGFKQITSVIKSFDSAQLTFSPVLVEIDGGNVNLYVSWKGTWTKDAKTTEDRGMAVFVFKGVPLKVDSILRGNPFKYPE